MTIKDLKTFIKDTISTTKFGDVKSIEIGNYEMITEKYLNDIAYPLVFFMFPPERQTIYLHDIRKVRWSFDVAVLMNAKFDDLERIESNQEETEKIAKRVFAAFEDAAEDDNRIQFYETDNTEKWIPKEHFGGDNCNGWLIPMSIITIP